MLNRLHACLPILHPQQIEGDEEAKKALDWVREMYAFSVAAALEHVQLEVQVGCCCCLFREAFRSAGWAGLLR